VPARTWSPDRWTSLVTTLVDAGISTVVTGGADERALAARVARPGATDASGTCDLDALLGILAGADAVIVGNTGPAHLAAAVGAPVVSIYAPTVPAVRWHPWGVPHVVLGDQAIACAACRSRVCPLADQPCLGSIADEDALAALTHLGVHPRRTPGADRIAGSGRLR
jgi:ADP-heptose:LPS heptosyltransferase